jgi:hypothetical protein
MEVGMDALFARRSLSSPQGPWVSQMILESLKPGLLVTIEDLVNRVPEVRWEEIFLAVDRLRKDGELIIHWRDCNVEVSTTQDLGEVPYLSNGYVINQVRQSEES